MSAAGILVAGMAGLALVPAVAVAAGSRGTSRSAAVAASFCSRISLASISSIVGHRVSLLSEVSRHGSICIYRGGTGATAFEQEVTISMATHISTKITSQEAAIAKQYAKQRAHCSFSRLPSLGTDGFGFRCSYAIFTLSGVGATRGTTGYSLFTLGRLSVAKEEQLLRLGIHAG
ncbi:MAG TPA: hypothetical protein VNN74_02245 [Candidatus Micrarchaeia archaeon]|nr:hypothetical protein [Candidatus Micrarchaeia archaeon]